MTEREVMAELVRFVGVLTYGKERWFKQNGCWYDRMFGDCIQNEVFLERITEAINDEITDRPTGEWVDDCTCSICHWMHEDNNGFALITKYNYCPNCGAKMRGEEE